MRRVTELIFLLVSASLSFIYSWSISHFLEHEFFCLGRLGSQGSKEKKVDLRNFEQLFRVVFSTFDGQKKIFFFFFEKVEKVEKIGYHSNSNFECNTERGSIE